MNWGTGNYTVHNISELGVPSKVVASDSRHFYMPIDDVHGGLAILDDDRDGTVLIDLFFMPLHCFNLTRRRRVASEEIESIQ